MQRNTIIPLRFRLTYDQQQAYLTTLFNEASSDSDNDFENDGTEDEWVPSPRSNDLDMDDISDAENAYIAQDNQIEFNENVPDEYEPADDSDDDAANSSVSASSGSDFVAKDGTIWRKVPPTTTRTQKHNILRQKSGPVLSTKQLSIADTFKCIFSEMMVDIIVRATNRKADRTFAKWNEENPDENTRSWKHLTSKEFYSYIGVLITMGTHHSNSEHHSVLWRSDSYPVYRATMSNDRFRSLCRFIRFDNEATRAERLLTDKAAAITDIWLMLNDNLASKYVASDCVTVDEQLFPYRGRTRFTQYIPSKPAKYGLKIFWVCDAKTSYPITGQLYTGKGPGGPERDQGQRVVRDLCYQFKGSGRNITMDNFFSALPLARLLLSWQLTMVGTLKQNKTYIPTEMKKSSTKTEFSSTFGFSDDGKVSLCSYVPKKNRIVTLLSTMHTTINTDGPKCKPEAIIYYNSTKGGVDSMDKMLTHYTTKRRTLRWPQAMFYNIIDVAALATYIIYSKNNPFTSKSSHSRRTFLQDLGKQLAMPTIEERATNQKVMAQFSPRSGIQCMMGRPVIVVHQSSSSVPRTGSPHVGSCYVCRTVSSFQRKTRKNCSVCKRPICNEHSEAITKCNECIL